ncbi:MAG: hypothetical protein Q9M89_10050 [Persephonella sp.]|nr:hypothetical protein [Persephonella sp.]
MKEELIKELLSIQKLLDEMSNSIGNIIKLLNKEKAQVNLKYEEIKETIETNKNEYKYRNELIQFLENSKLKVVNYEDINSKKAIFNIVKFIGEKYDSVGSFIKEIKKV